MLFKIYVASFMCHSFWGLVRGRDVSILCYKLNVRSLRYNLHEKINLSGFHGSAR